ncbi:hypothetical protein APHAL10511_002782 [Amanita phalloides]|nr:hypothetical protein APHAL10511_002782 [Amanita phalloides]
MRWSLILPTLITVLSIHSLVSLAAVTPPNLVELESRSWAKASSKTYRKSATQAPHAYIVGQSHVARKDLTTPKIRQAYGQRKLKDPNLHADHIFEAQMLKKHLQKNGVKSFKNLPSHLQEKAKEILNAPENMAFIHKDINMAKGKSVGNGLVGKGHPRPDKLRDSYMKASYPSAIDTAKKLDQAFKADPNHSHLAGFEDTLHNTMNKLKIPKPGVPSPPAPSGQKSHVGSQSKPKRPARKYGPKLARKSGKK